MWQGVGMVICGSMWLVTHFMCSVSFALRLWRQVRCVETFSGVMITRPCAHLTSTCSLCRSEDMRAGHLHLHSPMSLIAELGQNWPTVLWTVKLPVWTLTTIVDRRVVCVHLVDRRVVCVHLVNSRMWWRKMCLKMPLTGRQEHSFPWCLPGQVAADYWLLTNVIPVGYSVCLCVECTIELFVWVSVLFNSGNRPLCFARESFLLSLC